MIPLVDLGAQYATIRAEVADAMQAVLDTTSFILGPALSEFEARFAAACGVGHCVGVASGTDALHLMLRALGVGPGDEVIVPAMTFAATPLAVFLAGATPVLVDVRDEDALLDPSLIEAALTPLSKAILPVHLYGRCADMDAIQAVADRHGLLVLEDAAQAHGAAYRGRPAGSLGRAAGFSFYPGKNLGAYGDGGAVVTDDAALADSLRTLRNWGARKKYHHDELGLNSRLDTLQAAILGVKLKHLEGWNEARRGHAARYSERLAGIEGVRLPAPSAAGDVHAQHLYVVRCADRDARLERLHARGVGAGIHYPFPIHALGAYAELRRPAAGLPQAEAWARECLSLPMFAELSSEQLDAVCAAMRN